MIGEILLFAAISLISYAFYKWATINNDFFERRNIKYLKPRFLVGNTGGLFFNKYTAAAFSQKLYQAFPDESIYGMFDFRVPQYILRDPEAIKKIGVKDFDSFEDHRTFTDEKTDKLFGNSLFFMKGEKWRQMRATLSPAFTGSKMRQMFELVTECTDDVVKHFLNKVQKGEKINIEMKDFFTRYTNDVIASCAFGLKINSFEDPTNEFFLNGKIIMNFTGLKQLFRIVIINKLPAVARALNISFTDPPIAKSFRDTILDTMDIRKKNNIHRPDMINIMMQIREGTLKLQAHEKVKEKEGFATVEESEVGKVAVNRAWSDDEIVAQCFLFFVAGFDTSSTMLMFASYELAASPDIQQKLYEEIVETDQQLGGKRITYDAIQKMKYLDQVICEVLRKWPPAIQVDRICVKDYVYDGGNKLQFKVEKGTPFLIPIYGIQHDPQYFPHPEKFDPERFSDENKDRIISGTYIPFGIGPRNCIGSRFALMEIKAILYYLLLNFSFEPNAKTTIPIELIRSPFSLLPKNGMHLELKPRHKITMLVELLLFAVLILYLFYKWATVNNDFFKRRNIKHVRAKFLLGNIEGKVTATEFATKVYQAFPDEPFNGFFDFREPMFIIRDPEIIKQIAIKNSDHFENHRALFDEKADRLWSNTLFFMQNEKWRNMRANLSPAFTGSKMRQMFELVAECADDVVKHFLNKVKNGDRVNLEMKDFFTRYTNDVIATCAFGLKINSFENPENEFYIGGRELMNFTGLKQAARYMLVSIMPTVARALDISYADARVSREFRNTILDTMDMRKKNNIHRPDMINIMMQIREGTLKNQTDEKVKENEGFATVEESEVDKVAVNRAWSDDEIVAQCFVFFVAGFESSSTLLSFTSYELAANPDIQQKLYEEIIGTDQELGGKRITYDALQKMKYLDQVICESLRKWPPSTQVDRVCNKDYIYDDGNKTKLEVEKGTAVLFPIYGIQHDPQYFPNSEKFDPERFSDENKDRIISGTYIPFGIGPRNCIGSRFALMEVKAILYYLLLNFSFEPNEKTEIPIKLKKQIIMLIPENGLHLELKPRKK
ncbi:uncharacterized protein LOC129570685 [Sitodiplosis mosellana]|uniref:uncharacterized protein LOC129570685 n=1 Tax=Sitodiplosis mosellana TaxID=263140 RepID=UPI0024441958|nr:uncharacterized protein LOC129570685 [Sitodiplosis mosellana]